MYVYTGIFWQHGIFQAFPINNEFGRLTFYASFLVDDSYFCLQLSLRSISIMELLLRNVSTEAT